MGGDSRGDLGGPTDAFALLYQICNHLTGQYLVGVRPALKKYDYPIWDFDGFNQVFVDPSKMGLVT